MHAKQEPQQPPRVLALPQEQRDEANPDGLKATARLPGRAYLQQQKCTRHQAARETRGQNSLHSDAIPCLCTAGSSGSLPVLWLRPKEEPRHGARSKAEHGCLCSQPFWTSPIMFNKE